MATQAELTKERQLLAGMGLRPVGVWPPKCQWHNPDGTINGTLPCDPYSRLLYLGRGLIPEGQRRAVESLVGGDRARTYIEAAEVSHVSVNTLYTHLRRIRINHPVIHKAIYRRRWSRLRERHSEVMARD